MSPTDLLREVANARIDAIQATSTPPASNGRFELTTSARLDHLAECALQTQNQLARIENALARIDNGPAETAEQLQVIEFWYGRRWFRRSPPPTPTSSFGGCSPTRHNGRLKAYPRQCWRKSRSWLAVSPQPQRPKLGDKMARQSQHIADDVACGVGTFPQPFDIRPSGRIAV